jgi:hypothetical protein
MLATRRRGARLPGPSVTPAQASDLRAAREAQKRVARSVEQVKAVRDVSASRWPRVDAVRSELSRIRRENHLADDLGVIFRERP